MSPVHKGKLLKQFPCYVNGNAETGSHLSHRKVVASGGLLLKSGKVAQV